MKSIIYTIVGLLIATPVFATDKTINELTAQTTFSSADYVAIWDTSESATYKMAFSSFDFLSSDGTDNVDDTHINWGSGANQVNLADIPGGVAGAYDFDLGGATSLELPNGTNPTTNTTGELAFDSDDAMLEAYDGTASRIMAAALKCETFAILEPDEVQTITDDVVLKHFMADAYPHGVTIESIAISSSSAYTSETVLIEAWDDRAGSTQTTIESITSSSQYQEDDGTLSSSAVAADGFLVANLDDTPEDVAMLEITVTYRITPGD